MVHAGVEVTPTAVPVPTIAVVAITPEPMSAPIVPPITPAMIRNVPTERKTTVKIIGMLIAQKMELGTSSQKATPIVSRSHQIISGSAGMTNNHQNVSIGTQNNGPNI